DARSLATNITEGFADTNTGAATIITRSYAAYSLLAYESVFVGGTRLSTAGQAWDSALRRSSLTMMGMPFALGYGFGWRADNLLASTAVGQQNQTGAGTYTYTDAGLPLTRTLGTRQTIITGRDGS